MLFAHKNYFKNIQFRFPLFKSYTNKKKNEHFSLEKKNKQQTRLLSETIQ